MHHNVFKNIQNCDSRLLFIFNQAMNETVKFQTYLKYVHEMVILFQARNKDQEAEIIAWIEAVLGEKLPNQPYEDVLRDGVILCNLINKIAPGSVKKIQSKGTNFQLMENIQR